MSTHTGGHPVDAFVHEHFTKVGPKTASKRWNMCCNYCPATSPIIVHWDVRCLQHLSKPNLCPNAPADVKMIAIQRLMAKGGIEILEPDSDEEVDLVNTAAGSSQAATAVASKKAKVSSDGGAVTTKRTLDAYLERPMTEDEINKSNVRLLRCVKLYLI